MSAVLWIVIDSWERFGRRGVNDSGKFCQCVVFRNVIGIFVSLLNFLQNSLLIFLGWLFVIFLDDWWSEYFFEDVIAKKLTFVLLPCILLRKKGQMYIICEECFNLLFYNGQWIRLIFVDNRYVWFKKTIRYNTF